jgi:P pilus assembly chaperone PapD
MVYKYDDESEDLFRINVEEIPIEELERILHESE